MKPKHIVPIVVIGLALTVTASLADLVPLQEDKLFTTDGVIQEGDFYKTVAVYDTPPAHTTVNMTGGTVGKYPDAETGLYTFDSSIVNISGGDVYYLETYDASKVNISAGQVYDLETNDQSELNINGGAVGDWGSFMASHGTSTINVYEGGSFVGGSYAELILSDASTLNIFGGRVDVLVGVVDSSVMNVLGGYMKHIGTSEKGNGVVNVYGGTINSFRVNTYIADTTTVNIYAYNVVYDPHDYWDKGGWWVSKLTGTAFDGTEITWEGLPDPATHPNINIIPEPCSFAVWAIGACGLLRGRKRYQKEVKGL